ncbi:MAG: type II toxin-antitoxin system VapC family toxin, partial [Micromonosporaceae bacterium]
MILVDSSAWIDFLRGRDSDVAARLKQLIQQGADLATTEPVIMELLAGADTPARLAALEKLTNGLPLLGIDPRLDFRAAAGLFAAGRRGGRTIRSLVDCLIASVAIRHDVALLHKDADFDVIAQLAPLRS